MDRIYNYGTENNSMDIIFLLTMFLLVFSIPLYGELRALGVERNSVFLWLLPYCIIKHILYFILCSIVISPFQTPLIHHIAYNCIVSLFPVLGVLILKTVTTRIWKVKNRNFYLYDIPTNLLFSFSICDFLFT